MTWRSIRFIEAVALFLLLAAAAPVRYVRSVAPYAPPDVTLTDARGERVRLAEVLDFPGPVVLQFIFTTCPAVCPTLSAALSGLQGETPEAVRRVSISIDPELDTPERLRDYARRFEAGPDGWFLTGSREDVDAVRKAFDAWSANKMSHEPLTFLRPAPGRPWVRLAGLLSAAELAAEIRRSLAALRPDPELGRQVYLGSCASCHRRSGFGMSEGGVYVPRVTGPALFQPRQLVRADLFRSLYQESQPKPYNARVRDPRLRPAYTPETLAVALREGRDPAGRTLDPVMPRYPLSDEEVGHLAAYLQGLSAVPSPGVDGATIHFATVITDGVHPGRRKAMLDVIEAYVRWKNTETKHAAARLGFSPWYRDEFHGSLREWKLHVWDLRGPARTWPSQLAEHYRSQPVFALLSGLGEGSWQPVHDFCERAEVPCLFPNTGLPAVSPPGAYALYLSPGLAVEAQALARHLKDSRGRIVQVYRDTDEGRVPAQALRDALGIVEERVIAPGEALTPGFWRHLVRETRPEVLVLWLGPEDAATLGPAAEALPQTVFSGGLLEDPSNVPAEIRERAWLTWPFALPGHEEPLAYRVRAWMRARRVEPSHERLQLNTWFVLAVADHALTHLVENFSRDFFVESVEEETENALSPGVFPSLSLGPGQRFASKGSYVLELAPGGLEAVGGWIVP